MDSVSKSDLTLEVKDRFKIPIQLKRHLSPKTVGIMLRSLPLDGNAHFLGKAIVYIESPVDSGMERSRTDFKRGDIAFYPAQGSICFFAYDVSLGKKMSPVGRIVSDAGKLGEIKPGDVLRIYAGTG